MLCNKNHWLKLVQCMPVQENVGVKEMDAGDCETTYLAKYETELNLCFPHITLRFSSTQLALSTYYLFDGSHL